MSCDCALDRRGSRRWSWWRLAAAVSSAAACRTASADGGAATARTRPRRCSRTPRTASRVTTIWSTPAGEDVSIGATWRSTMMANSARDPYWQAACAARPSIIRRMPRRFRTNAPRATCRWRSRSRARRAARARCSRICRSRARSARLRSGSPPTASPAPCAIRSRPTGSARARASTANFVLRPTPADGARVDLRTVPDRRRPDDDHALGERLRAGGGAAHQAVGAVRHVPHAHHAGARTERRGDRIAARADELSGVAAQRLQHAKQRSCQSCHMPAAPGPIRSLGARRRARHAGAARVRRRQRLHGAAAEPLSHRARRRGAAGRARGHRAGDRSASCSRTRRRSTLSAPRSRAGTLAFDVDDSESHRPQVPDRVSVPPRVAARHGEGRDAARPSSNPARSTTRRRDSRQRQRRGRRRGSSRTTTRSRSPIRCRSTSRSSATSRGVPTTGLLTATQYLKDNRLLPRGFDKATAAAEIGVYGSASARSRTSPAAAIAFATAIRVSRERAVHRRRGAAIPVDRLSLGAQPRALRRPEPKRFVSYYTDTSAGSSVVIATADD